MRNFIIFSTLVILLTTTGFTPEKDKNKKTQKDNKAELTDENLFRNEIRDAAIEAARELGINPDSTYIPFKDSIR